MTSIRIIKAGLLTTVQDLGRWGYQTQGVPPAGPMDLYSHRLANHIVGNLESAATLEVTLIGPVIEFLDAALFVVTGADWRSSLDGRELPRNTVCQARAGERLAFHERRAGARAYVAFAGGVDVPPILGSRSTHCLSRMGGLHGGPLAVGDLLPIGPLVQPRPVEGRSVRPALPTPCGGARLRVLPGPQDDLFDEHALTILQSGRYIISPQSNRMGYRLEGPALPGLHTGQMISEATAIGSLQVPAAGQPILLMADRQTAGGYPKIATVITADLPIAGQLAPGDWIEFVVCGRHEALDALLAIERHFVAASSAVLAEGSA